jgi:hypothetical protein
MGKYWTKFLFIFILLLPAGSLLSAPNPSWRPAARPVQIADVYGHADNIKTGEQRAQAYDALILHISFADRVRNARHAGFQGPALQYIIADVLIGPEDLYSEKAQKQTCAQLGITDIQTKSNNINMYKDFCAIHDSIVTQQKLVDLDLDGTGDIAASESWFLHDPHGNRLHRSSGGGTGYYHNPQAEGVRKLFKERLLYELEKNRTEHLFDGIYLDNIALGYGNTDRHDKEPVEYPLETDAEDAVFGFVRYLYQEIKAVNSGYLLWANLIDGKNDGEQWDRYSAIVDGGLNEDFAITWSSKILPPDLFYNQLLQAQKWIRDGNAFVGVAQGDGNSSLGKFGLAAYLLIADGIRSYYHYTDTRDMYNHYYEYPEYTAALGYPLGSFTITGRDQSGNPISYQRRFECGKVTLDLSNQAFSIEKSEICQFYFRLFQKLQPSG